MITQISYFAHTESNKVTKTNETCFAIL